MLRTRILDFVAAGSTTAGTISLPTSRYAGAYYTFNPDRGTGDVTISNLGRALLAKSNAQNSDGVQELAPSATKIIHGDVVVSVNEVQAGDEVKVVVFYDPS